MAISSSNQLSLFDIQNYEYSILISPTKRIKEHVYYLKDRISKITKVTQRDLKSVPHISLMKMEYKDNDHLIISLVKHALLYTKRFQIELNGVNYYDNKKSKTVYLTIANPEPIVSLYNNIQSAFRFKEKPLNPHVTVVKSVENEDLSKIQQAIPVYHDNFWCNKITVLKKPISTNTRYTKIYEAYLN